MGVDRQTYMGIYDRGFYSPDTGAGRFRKYLKLCNLDRKRDALERRKDIAIGVITRVCAMLGLPADVREIAVKTFRFVVGASRERDIRRFYWYAFGSVLYVVRRYGFPVSIDEIRGAFEDLGIRIPRWRVLWVIDEFGRLGRRIGSRRPSDYLNRILHEVFRSPRAVGRLGDRAVLYRQRVLLVALDLLKMVLERGRGFEPRTVCACAIYGADKIVACRLGVKPVVTWPLVSRASGVHESTLRACYNELFKKRVKEETLKNVKDSFCNKI